jgi:hypothetical protein
MDAAAEHTYQTPGKYPVTVIYTAYLAANQCVAATTRKEAATIQVLSPPIRALSAPPTLAVKAPDTLHGREGDEVSENQTLSIQNIGGGTLQWTATPLVPWIVLKPTNGNVQFGAAPVKIDVSAKLAHLKAGQHSGSIRIDAPGASNTPQSVPVKLEVLLAPPTISVSPPNILHGKERDELSDTQTLSIRNVGAGTLHWTATPVEPWIVLSRTNGSVRSGATPVTIHVSAKLALLTAKASPYSGSIRINAPGATNTPQNVPVQLEFARPPIPWIWIAAAGALLAVIARYVWKRPFPRIEVQVHPSPKIPAKIQTREPLVKDFFEVKLRVVSESPRVKVTGGGPLIANSAKERRIS